MTEDTISTAYEREWDGIEPRDPQFGDLVRELASARRGELTFVDRPLRIDDDEEWRQYYYLSDGRVYLAYWHTGPTYDLDYVELDPDDAYLIERID